jgi:cytoskeletal protein RodZ
MLSQFFKLFMCIPDVLRKENVALLVAFVILIFTLWSNVGAHAQNRTTAANSTTSSSSQQHVSKIKITSPTRGQQVPVGKDLTISGTSIDNATSNCQVSVIVNNVKPYQNATATGTGGAADYSKWNFALTSKYTTIKPDQNRITAKYECANNPASKGFSSVNVTGVKS